MTLGGALQIGRSALLAHQAAIEVAGNNLANIATAGYHRQTVTLKPLRHDTVQQGLSVGRGVQLQSITREVDAALEARIRSNIGDRFFSLARQEFLAQIEAMHNEFTDADLSTLLNDFLNAWSELTNNPQDNSLRTLVLRQGTALSGFAKNLRSGIDRLHLQINQAIDGGTTAANDLLTAIENVNTQIIQTGRDSGLLDHRDALLAELAEFLDISVLEHPSGAADVFVGSMPAILNGISRGIEVRRQTNDGELEIDLVLSSGGTVISPQAGRLGALIQSRETDINFAIDELDSFINTFIFEINKIHSQGQGVVGFDSVTASNRVLDQAAALDDPDAGLKFVPVHGSFQLHLTQKSTGERITRTVSIDLDGIDPANDTRLPALAASLDAVDNIDSFITPDGRLVIDASTNDFEISFSDDSSGVLAVLGINTFFDGGSAKDISVNAVVEQSPSLIAAALGHEPGDNRNAIALAGLSDLPLARLDDLSIPEAWAQHVENFAVRLGLTNQQLEAEAIVGENLTAQQQAASGVNSDEEVINLLAFQRAYQSSARFLQVVDELLETLIALL